MSQSLKNKWYFRKWYFHLRREGWGRLFGLNGYVPRNRVRLPGSWVLNSRLYRGVFLWPWNENAQTKRRQQTNGNRAIWLVYRMDKNAHGFWLVKRTLRRKNLPENILEIALTSYCNTIGQLIEQCLLHIRVFFGGKTKSLCFDLFMHWLIKQITNTYQNHFFMLYENRSISDLNRISFCNGRLKTSAKVVDERSTFVAPTISFPQKIDPLNAF